MSFVLNEEEQMLRDSARAFLDDRSPVSALRKLRDEASPDGFDRALWKEMGDMGWCGILIEEAYGGADMGYAAAGFLLREMGRSLTSSPFLATAVLAASALRYAGTDAQKENWLPKIAAGEAVIGVALDEKARHDPDTVNTTAIASGNGFKLSGAKRFVACGMGADAFIVTAKDEAGEIGFYLVPGDAEGVIRQPRRTVDSQVPADVTFNDVQLAADARMDAAEDAGLVYKQVLDAGRACLAAESLGVGEEAFDMTIEYLKGREQFGQAIGAFQGLQHRAAHNYSELELARSLVMKALRTLDEQPSQAPIWVAAAKAKAVEASRLAAQDGIQMFGGVGMTDEYDIGLFYKRAQAAGEFLGDHNFSAGRVASLSGY